MARREREEFVYLLSGLTAEQWDRPSLCAGWTVRDVVAHTVAYQGQSRSGLVVNTVRARFDLDRLNEHTLRTHAGFGHGELLTRMREGVEPRGAGALYGGRVALIECLIHQQDIRRPLHLPRTVPDDHVLTCLRYARRNPVIAGAGRWRGIRWVADDLEWEAGSGAEVRGAGEAILLAMTGRVSAVRDELEGAGVAVLGDMGHG